MADPTPPDSLPFQGSIIQFDQKIITASGSSIIIRKRVNAKKIKERQIFSKAKIHFLTSIGEKRDDKAFFLALSSKRIALFHLKGERKIAIFKLDEKIVDHGTVEVLDIRWMWDGEFIVKLIIPIAFYSGAVRKMQLTVIFLDAQIIKQKMKCVEELRMEDENMRFCIALGNGNFFGFYEDTVVKSDSLVSRAEEPSTEKKMRIAIVARELWHEHILIATENETIRVVRVINGNKNESDSMNIFSEGQCVPPYCTLRCKEPSVLTSTENTVIVGTKRGEVHFLNDQLKLIYKIDTEGGPINCLKVYENDSEFLWVGFESGELRMLFMPDSEQNDDKKDDMLLNYQVLNSDEENECDIDPSVGKDSRQRNTIVCKKSETEMECLEKGCYYKTPSARAFLFHLRRKHRTTLASAGLVLRCQCGWETRSWKHSTKCEIPNFTVVRKKDFVPIRKLDDKKMTPQCALCKVFPKTIHGYSQHLYHKHGTSIDRISCFLKCGVCGRNFYTRKASERHSNKCESRFFSLLKISEEGEKKDETEMDQTVDA